MANIEDNVMQRLQGSQMNEYASYQPNQLLANAIGNYITGMGFFYDGYIRRSSVMFSNTSFKYFTARYFAMPRFMSR